VAEGEKYNSIMSISETIGDLERRLDTFILDVDSEIIKMRATGMSEQAIYDSLMYDMDNNTGVFGVLKGGIERQTDEMVSQVTQTERIKGLPQEDLYYWNLDPTVAEHCPTCLANSMRPAMTLNDWQMLGIPGSGTTECGDYCCCALDKEKLL